MPIKIDLGCADKKPEGFIGVDKAKLPGVDVVHDCEQGLPFEDNYVDEIRAYDFLEHISSKIKIMDEIWRVLKPNGIFYFKVPDAEKGQGADQDPTHVSRWVRNSFKYYENDYYRNLYGIKAKFKIGKLESVEYEIDYWGKLNALMGYLIAEKGNNIQLETVESSIKSVNVVPNRIFTTDDLSIGNLKYFEYFDRIKVKYPEFKLIAFTIARKDDKDEEDIEKSEEFKKWYEARKDWVEIGVHGYDHMRPQEGWRNDQEEYIKKSFDILRPYLPKRFLYRAPGFRTLSKTEGILKKLGFAGIAHQQFIKYFDTGEIVQPLLNTHCGPNFENPITEIWNKIVI